MAMSWSRWAPISASLAGKAGSATLPNLAVAVVQALGDPVADTFISAWDGFGHGAPDKYFSSISCSRFRISAAVPCITTRPRWRM